MEKVINEPRNTNDWKSDLHLFSLEGLLPAGQALSVNTTYLIVSLVSTAAVNGHPILLERPVTERDMRLLLSLLEMPFYCPYEVLHASLFCSYQELLAGLFSHESADRAEWQTIVEEQRRLLLHAQELGTWKREMRPLYKTLSEIRPKLHPFGLEIATSESRSAYRLMALPFPQQE